MSDTIKGFRGKDGPILLDYSGVANVPGAVKSIGELTAAVGDHFEVASVDENGRISGVKAVEKPGGGSGQNGNGLSTAAANLLVTILRSGVYSTDQSANITALAAELAVTEPEQPDIPVVPDEPNEPDEPAVATYTVTNNLTNVTTSNAAGSVTEGASYAATLTAVDGYELDAVTVTMGGVDITGTVYVDGSISIATVSGDIVITASAVAAPVEIPELGQYKYCTTTAYVDDGSSGESLTIKWFTAFDEVVEEDTDVEITVEVSKAAGAWSMAACSKETAYANSQSYNAYYAVYLNKSTLAAGTHTFNYTIRAGHRLIVGVGDNWWTNLSKITVTKQGA